MAITITHVFELTDDGVLNPKEFRHLVNECPGVQLPGVRNVIVYRHTCKQFVIADVNLENYAAMDSWRGWWNDTPEGNKWGQ
ncbi:MAG: hypothetical protein CL915_06580 [Deltaproteobacteria bacterium]|jgi:hypothetical protein|nr:hypothetical protein [Deltaproteobacteria bacterium]